MLFGLTTLGDYTLLVEVLRVKYRNITETSKEHSASDYFGFLPAVLELSQNKYEHAALNNYFVCLMVFNATFNNISVISWWSLLLVEEPEDPEKTTDLLLQIDVG
jgi:hypothetical protein